MSFDEILDLTADVFFHFVILVEFGTTLLWQTDHFLWLLMRTKMSAMSSQTRPPRNVEPKTEVDQEIRALEALAV